MSVRIGALQFNSGSGFDGFYISKLDGWDVTPEVRRDETAMQQRHGSFGAQSFLESRVMSISGRCYADSPQKLLKYSEQLSGVLAGGLPQRIVVERAGEMRWAVGQLASKTEFDIEVWGQRASYQIQVWFPDPRKFGNIQAFPLNGTPFDGVVAYQYGNFPATPTITVNGSASGYTVNGPTGFYVVTRALQTGHPHVIDMNTGLLSVDGVTVYGAVSRADTWTIPPGVEVLQTVTPVSGGVAAMRVVVTDTYV